MSSDPRLGDQDQPVPLWIFQQEQTETRRRFDRVHTRFDRLEGKLDELLGLRGRRRWQLIVAGAGALFGGVVSLLIFALTGGMS